MKQALNINNLSGGDFLRPNVSLVNDTKSLFYNPLAQEEPELPYLTITALEDDFQINLRRNPTTVYYSLNGTDWNELQTDEQTPAISSGEKIYFKGNAPQGKSTGMFYTEKRFNLSGNCMSMLFGDEAEGKTDLTGYKNCFMGMFNSLTGLVSISKNFLPATTLAADCYSNMFLVCTSLVNAPLLPATTLAEGCYGSMFAGCTSLTQAPELPATELTSGCYNGMFNGCTSLVNAPELPATELTSGCYRNMFNDCTSLNYIKMLATDISATGCLSLWVNNVSPTGTFVKSKDTAWDESGVVPEGWTVETI